MDSKDKPALGYASTVHKSRHRKWDGKERKGDPNKHLAQNRSSKRPTRINLKAVAEVLAARGYDPTEEILNQLESGELEADVATKTWLTLLEYTQAKKKAVEITATHNVRAEQISDAELMRIALRGAASDAVDADVIDVEALPAPDDDEEVDPLS
ncbi:MAG TPA: hypothetical protein VFM48_16465 [Aquabacterium sp.]|nr:hypothetical protein [Aquabacterium sp.]